MREVRIKVEAAIDEDRLVLIEGENGTGKEVVARYIHLHSQRATDPFVRVNCAAVSAGFLDLELFGFGSGRGEPRRNTAAINPRRGGTAFFDEIGEMDLAVQQELVELIDARQSCDRGSRCRIVCSSSVNLDRAMLERRVTESLVSRLNHRVSLVPLRERKQDIPMLCEYLLGRAAQNYGRPVPQLSSLHLDRLREMDWPGNIRELENWIARVVIFGLETVNELEPGQKTVPEGNRLRRHRAFLAPVGVRRRSRRPG
ncbi:MAG: sigma-54-dependent Fis family transcriptional regulator [Acidobacteria bacterium]|nr:sigma-54-dependent Fis family transcriptional regulator [Acidobacteriota bacterium]